MSTQSMRDAFAEALHMRHGTMRDAIRQANEAEKPEDRQYWKSEATRHLEYAYWLIDQTRYYNECLQASRQDQEQRASAQHDARAAA